RAADGPTERPLLTRVAARPSARRASPRPPRAGTGCAFSSDRFPAWQGSGRWLHLPSRFASCVEEPSARRLSRICLAPSRSPILASPLHDYILPDELSNANDVARRGSEPCNVDTIRAPPYTVPETRNVTGGRQVALDLNRLHGIFPPILTPQTDDEEVDHASLRRLVDYLLGQGVHGIWATGTTGEFPCFSHSERANVVQTVVDTVGGRVPV